MSRKPIYVTQPSLPPLEEFIPYLKEIWESKVLTNGGPFHQKLELELSRYLDVKEVALFNNGMSALITALQSLNLSGEVITTPYSFVATTHALMLNNLKPVFVDIDSRTLNIDPAKIEEAITPRTSAILGVHCYGNPCDTKAIDLIAKKHKLKVVYDAAHAFGVKQNGINVLNHGDLSILSFHATKVFNTFEGGAVICHDERFKQYINELKNFGIKNETTVNVIGNNGKISELNTALGVLQLKYIDSNILSRKKVDEYYRKHLCSIKGITCVSADETTQQNYSYFPILVTGDYSISRDELYEKLKKVDIFARRYFYPLISSLPMYKDFSSSSSANLPVATRVAQQVLCLPIYPSLHSEEQDKILKIINENK